MLPLTRTLLTPTIHAVPMILSHLAAAGVVLLSTTLAAVAADLAVIHLAAETRMPTLGEMEVARVGIRQCNGSNAFCLRSIR